MMQQSLGDQYRPSIPGELSSRDQHSQTAELLHVPR